VTITIKDFAYDPVAVTVSPGATVTVVNEDNSTHTVTAKTGNAFDTGVIQASGGTTTFTAPTQPGDYPYICSIHTYMHGTLTVK
jgi:plastocyanin